MSDDTETAEVSLEDLNTWYKLQEQLKEVQAAEMALRLKIFKSKFKNPKEGVNSTPLSEGWVLKADYSYNRKILIPELTLLSGEFQEAGIDLSSVIKNKPEISISAYKALNDGQKNSFDRCLEIKPGAPQMKIVLPKRAAK